jgi:hypothetical protein
MPPFFNDTFTEASNTTLSSHTPDIGTSWTRLWGTDASTRVLQVESVADQLRCSGNSGDYGMMYTADATYPTANYEVQATFITTFNAITPLYLLARVQDQENMYAVRLVLSSGGSNAQLYKKVSGTWSTLGSAVTIADGSVVKLSVNGTAIKVYDDGVEVIGVTDSDISAAGKAGIGHGGGAELVASTDDTRSTNMLDSFGVTDLGSGGQTVAVVQNTETDTAQAVAKSKAKAIGQNTEADTSQAISRIKNRAIGINSETDAPQAVLPAKARTLGQSTETDSAQVITLKLIRLVNLVSEADTSQAITPAKRNAVAIASEADSAQAVTWKIIRLVAQVTETDEPLTIAAVTGGEIVVELGQPGETDTVQTITADKVKAIGQNSEADTAQAIARVKIVTVSQVSETDLAQSLFPLKRVSVVQVEEVDLSQAVAHIKQRAIGQAGEVDSAQVITLAGPIIVVVGQVVEADSALSITVISAARVAHYVYLISAESRIYLIPAATADPSRIYAIPQELRIAEVSHD